MFFDPVYFMFVGPFFLLSMWASFKVKSSFKKWSSYRNSLGMTGAQIARTMLDRNGLHDVKVEHVHGSLSDHYDPSSRTLRLSDDTYASNSIAAAGVAAHEAGHAIQHKVNYPLLTFRSTIVPLASFGSNLSWILIMIGMGMMFFLGSIGYYVALAGVIFFGVVVIFQIVTVPVEIDASNRAKKSLPAMGIASTQEQEAVSDVLNAAAWTYVAAAFTAVATLLYFLLRLGLLGGRN
ncbi:MAG: zinc metallopeptidase [Leptospiraceae bacterium]|nr:zinc metallopeptidase [Leptospiraceae bacterium]